jgi:hypothetical protein
MIRYILAAGAAVAVAAFAYDDGRLSRRVVASFYDMRTDASALAHDRPASAGVSLTEVTEAEGYTTYLDVPETYGIRENPLTLPSGFPAATNTWDAASPLVDATTGGTYTLTTGSISTVGTPFCSGKNYDYVEDNNGLCRPAVKIGGTAAGYGAILTAPAGAFDFGTDKTFSIAYLAHVADMDNAATAVQLIKDGVNGSYLGFGATNGACKASLSNGGSATDSTESDGKLGWAMCVFSYTFGGNQVMYGNNGDTTTSADVSANTDLDESGDIGSGALATFGTTTQGAALVRAWYWDGTALTAAQAETLVEWAKGVHDVSATATAPLFRNGKAQQNCWVDGKIESMGGAFPQRGCSPNLDQNPASTDFATGIMVEALVGGVVGHTARNVQSRFQSSWTQSGTVLTSAQDPTVQFFRHPLGRKVGLLADNDAAAVEYVHQTVSMTNANTGEDYMVCVYAAPTTGTPVVDVQVVEQTGGACSTTTTNWTAQTTTSGAVDVYRFAGTFQDGDCTDFIVRISPSDFADVATTGSINAMVNVFWSESGVTMDRDTCPNFVDNTISATENGEQILQYATAGLYNSGAFRRPTQYIWNSTRLCPTKSHYGSEDFLNFNNGGTATSYKIVMNNADILSPSINSTAGTPGTGVLTFASSPVMNDIHMTGSISYNGATDSHTITVTDDNENFTSTGTTNRADMTGLTHVNVGNRADENVMLTCGTINKLVVY